MNAATIEVTTDSLSIEVSVNGSRTPDVTVRHRAGGKLIAAEAVSLLDGVKREEWVVRMEREKDCAALGAEIRNVLPDLAAQFIAVRSKAEPAKTGQGEAIEFPEPEPWPESVALAGVLREMESLFARFLVMPDGAATAAALWVVLTYCVEYVSVLPKLALLSATKRCGKTSFLRLLGRLTHRSCPAANISAAAMFRTVEMVGPTLLIDEADQFLKGQPDLIGMFNAGHTRDTAFVIRNVGEDWTPRKFSVFAPMVVACIGKLPTPTLEDRSITIHMERKPAGTAEVEDFPDDPAVLVEVCTPICRRIVRWVAEHGAEVRDAKPVRPAGLHDRAKANWRGLFALADLAGGEWPAKARAAALRLLGEADASDAKETLLADLHALFIAEGDRDRLSSDSLVRSLVKMEDRPYAEWGQGRMKKPMTTVGLAALLRPFKVRPRMMRDGDDGYRGYYRSDFQPLWRRYGILVPIPLAQPATPATDVDSQALTPVADSQRDAGLLRLEKRVSPYGSTVVAGVAGQEPPLGDSEGVFIV